MIELENWHSMDYGAAWQKQKELFDLRVQAKSGTNELPDVLVFCEHNPVYTLGKSGVAENLLVDNQLLREKNVSFFKTDRGGDITFHGPGQIVAYPIFDLEHFQIGLRTYIHLLEEAVILFLADFGLQASRLEGATGVWLDVNPTGKPRKICAIGVKSSRFVTMHGLALNINTDLSFYQYINPCGFTDKGVTSLETETGQKQDMDLCRQLLYEKLVHVFQL